MEEFAKKLKELRKEKNISLIQLENAVGISKSSISDWENGKSIPNAKAVVALAKFFEVSTDYLLGLTDF